MPDPLPDAIVDIRTAHREALRDHAIELLRMGHARLSDPSSLSSAEEETITGLLKQSVQEVIQEDPSAPSWVVHYDVVEEEKLNSEGRLGKSRRRIDICVKRSWTIREAHPKFRIEAKRLKGDGRLGHYFGKEGMGCFLEGTYPLTHSEAAMLGYVQDGTLADWATKLAKHGRAKSKTLRALKGCEWQNFQCALAHSATSTHKTKTWPSLVLHHLLLRFS